MTDSCANIDKIRKALYYKHDRGYVNGLIDAMTLEDLRKILFRLLETSKSGLIQKDVDIFKMRYGIDYPEEHSHKAIARKYDVHFQSSGYAVTKVSDMIRRYLSLQNIKSSANVKTSEKEKMKIYVHKDHMEQENVYMKHLSAMTGEQLHSKADIAGELAGRDIVITGLSNILRNVVKRLDSLHDTDANKDMAELSMEIKGALAPYNLEIYNATSLEYESNS